MEERGSKRLFNIMFHDHNAPEDGIKLLMKIAAENMLDYVSTYSDNTKKTPPIG